MRSFQRIRQFSIFSLVLLLFLTIAISLFAYQVSPLRDPSFQPDSANGGSLIDWMQSVTEDHWLLLANIIAFLLSTNLTLIIWQRRRFNQNNKWLSFIIMTVTWTIFFGSFWLISRIYLLKQWLID
ncbi:MAG: hypothetical protein KME50_15855 [Nostoc desertorum CM1-VF14]|jgi:hypothetical protein|nr:hypothetical protein [Nostoc desertorum CM1-VF14]